MKKQAYQKPTIYNSDGTKAQPGTFDIRTDPLTNSTADGILDYYNNNLEALKAQADNGDTTDSNLRYDVDKKVNRSGDAMTGELSLPQLTFPLCNANMRKTGSNDSYTFTIFGDKDNFRYSLIGINSKISGRDGLGYIYIQAADGTYKSNLTLTPNEGASWNNRFTATNLESKGDITEKGTTLENKYAQLTMPLLANAELFASEDSKTNSTITISSNGYNIFKGLIFHNSGICAVYMNCSKDQYISFTISDVVGSHTNLTFSFDSSAGILTITHGTYNPIKILNFPRAMGKTTIKETTTPVS